MEVTWYNFSVQYDLVICIGSSQDFHTYEESPLQQGQHGQATVLLINLFFVPQTCVQESLFALTCGPHGRLLEQSLSLIQCCRRLDDEEGIRLLTLRSCFLSWAVSGH